MKSISRDAKGACPQRDTGHMAAETQAYKQLAYIGRVHSMDGHEIRRPFFIISVWDMGLYYLKIVKLSKVRIIMLLLL